MAPRDFNRAERVAGEMRRELARLIQLEVKDPSVGFVSVSDVEVSRDLSHARVFITVFEEKNAPDILLYPLVFSEKPSNCHVSKLGSLL